MFSGLFFLSAIYVCYVNVVCLAPVNESGVPGVRLTQRAPDWWESARFQAVCLA